MIGLLGILVCKAIFVLGISEPIISLQSAAERFENSVQQQTFQTVLTAIEERLHNLDNIYSMQLSETLETKLDQYHRKLEALDTRIIRLESLVMMNLDKISENISTKNYKDDVSRTQTYRKLDNIYDGISHRVSYVDRKFELVFDKIQSKVDLTLQRLERMEEDMVQRNTDIESELSETISILEDYKSSTANTEIFLLNMTDMLRDSGSRGDAQSINMSIFNFMNNFNETFSNRFDLLEDNTSKYVNITEKTNTDLNSLKMELKKDFNAYANKVADMNVDIWKRNDIVEESLKVIENMTKSTRTEVQNGVRALMLQIGKLPGNGKLNNDKLSLESLQKSVNISLDKIITNQELFLESCHRVQMDESQIESEISVMLGKLIDMLETKMTTVMKDLKALEKTVKNHDSRLNRNLNQANTNIISLFEKTTRVNDLMEKAVEEIKFYINSLFTFVQDVLPKLDNGNITESLLYDISVNISNLILLTNASNSNVDIKLSQMENNFVKSIAAHEKFITETKNLTDKLLIDGLNNQSHKITESLVELKKIVKKLKAKINNNNITDIFLDNTSETTTQSSQYTETICTQDYNDLIDIRAGDKGCRTKAELLNNPQLNKTILEIFGTPPTPLPTNDSKQPTIETKKKCPPSWSNLIDIRASSDDNCTSTTTGNANKRKLKKRRPTGKTRIRFNEDNSLTGTNADYEYSDLTETTTEVTTDTGYLQTTTESVDNVTV
ncbi:unnamed protein product [Ceutorhynchus assimilis]|uniref:Uncharacterized protein n=1 Tax=Ceutorhynchus assimilis TaxID=467358 RepID=A0A9N9MVA9_9CUCU|nr:unnamed protein product [Ceutorhynchus assimilis]